MADSPSKNSNELVKGLLKNKRMIEFNNSKLIDRTGLNEEIIKLVNQSYIRAIIYGNINAQSALNLTDKVILPYVDTSSIYFAKLYGLDKDHQIFAYLTETKDIQNIVIFRMKMSQTKKDLSMVGNYYYLGNTNNYRDYIFIHLLKLTLMKYYKSILEKQKIFQFKTVSLFNLGSIWYLSVITSGYRDPRELNKVMDEILLKARTKIEELDEEKEMYKIKESIFDYLTSKEKNLGDRTSKIRSEIKLNRYIFDFDLKLSIEQLSTEFTKTVLLNKFNELFITKIKKLSIQKNCSDEITFEDEGYVLNKNIPLVVTNETNYFHFKY